MNQDNFNMEIRKYLKKIGITSQREIANIVNQSISDGKLTGNETLKASAKIMLHDINFELEIDGGNIIRLKFFYVFLYHIRYIILCR